jgi:DNA-binding PadR family transcriptional regulator
LYLLTLLADGPRHGYELIRLLENRFLGLYAPSAGTIYPRLQRMEADGLVTHTAVGGRKVYEITDAGRAELTARAGELAGLESEISASVADLSTLADEVEQGVRGSVRDIKRELRQASRQVQAATPQGFGFGPGRAAGADAGAGVGAAGAAAAGSGGGNGWTGGPVFDLEQRAAQLLVEIRQLTRDGNASGEGVRASLVVIETALDQVRRLLRRE